VLGWNRFGEWAAEAGQDAAEAGERGAGAGECAAVYFGRLFAIEFLQPQFCVPGALDHAAGELGLSEDRVAQVREEDVRSLIRALD
jgi:hypothetical protein